MSVDFEALGEELLRPLFPLFVEDAVAVFVISDNRVADRRHLYANLVRAPSAVLSGANVAAGFVD